MREVLEQPGRNDHDHHRRHRHEERGRRDRDGRGREAQGDPEKDRHARADKPSPRRRPGSRSQSPRDRKRRRGDRGDRGESKEGDDKASHRSRRHGHTPSALPHGARHLKSSDRLMFEPLLAHYLETEKQLALHGLRDDEKESRWKRFVDRWNHHGLADSWYAPEMFLRVARAKQTPTLSQPQPQSQQESDSGSDSDDYGPALPPEAHQHQGKPARATLPTLDDLRERRELVDEEREAQRTADRAAHRLARKADRKKERERLDELVPRAAAGTRERQLEKKRALNDKMRSFRDKSPGPAEVDDNELLGGSGGGDARSDVHEYKRMVATAQKKRNEWEVRREEEQRARQAELDERREQYRAREAETVEMLRALARQRFG